MRIGVMGTGALGGYFGGRLAAAGVDVALVARGAMLEALRSDGLRVESPLGDLHLPDVSASDDPAEIGPVDAVLFLVKLPDTESAAEALAPMLGPETAVLTFQNGVTSCDRIASVVGAQRVIPGAAYIPADVRAPGVVRHSAQTCRVEFGEIDGRESARCAALRDAFAAAGVDATLADDMPVRLWVKFTLLSAISAITALTRLPIGPIRDDPGCWSLLCEAVEETAAVARVACLGYPDGQAERTIAFLSGMPPGVRASMCDDIVRGRRLELRDLSGAVARIGAAHDVPTPVHGMVARALAPYADGRPAAALG